MRRLLATGVVALLAAPAAAEAHVTVQPKELPAGGFARIDVRVPNERDDAGTTKVEVRLPPGFLSVSYQPVPGWKARIVKEKLDTPIEQHGEQITEQVDRVIFTGGVIGPGQFQDFPLSVGVPEGKPGAALKFPALQTYRGGEVVRWIGPEDSDDPAPVVRLTSGEDEQVAPAPAAQRTVADDDDDGGADGLAIAALIVGALGLIVAATAALLARRAMGRDETTPA